MTTTAIDLSQLPFPGVVEVVSFDQVYAERKAKLVSLYPAEQQAEVAATLELDSEPMAKILQENAYREVVWRQRVNDAARAIMLVYATGADLDQVVARNNIARLVITPADEANGTPAVMESDADLRKRALLAPLGFSVAGPAGAYISHALNADGAVLDAAVKSPADGEVLVTVLARPGASVSPAELVAKVNTALSAETVRPLTDKLTIGMAELVPYRVRATLSMFPGPDGTVAVAEAQRRIETYTAECMRIGRRVAESGIKAALHVSGVETVVLHEPAGDVVTTDTQAPRCSAIELEHR